MTRDCTVIVHPTALSCPVLLAFLQLETGRLAVRTTNPLVVRLRKTDRTLTIGGACPGRPAYFSSRGNL